MGLAFLVFVGIVLHRFLRLDLTQDWAAALHLPRLLSVLLAAGLGIGLVRRTVHLRAAGPSSPIWAQWLLWGWAGVSRVVSDGTGAIVSFVKDDYTKDVIFASLLTILCDSVRKLKTLAWAFVCAMIFISYIVVSQHDGPRKCFHFGLSGGSLNYVQTTDNRPCAANSDCFSLPPGEQNLRDEGWACEREGDWGIGTIGDRVRYVGTLADPNALSLALVMACALALGLIFWPREVASGAAEPEPGEDFPTEAPRLRERLIQVFLWAGVGLMSLIVLYAASRAAQAALALTFLAYFYQRIGVRGLLLAGTLGAPLLLISNRNQAEAAYSTFTRLQTQLNGYRAFLEQPLFGVGFGNYGRISFITAHNSFLLTATETGIVGSALFLLGIYLTGKFLWQVRTFSEEDLLPVQSGDRPRHSGMTPASPPSLAARVAELHLLQHVAMTLFAVLVGVGWCVSFLSLSFDVMWLYPMGLIGGFYGAVRDRLPEYRLRLRGWEIGLILVVGAGLPALFAILATHGLL